MNTQPSPARRWQSHLYVHGSESQINHQPGPANKPSGQRGFLLARLSPPASKPSERTLGAAGDEASRFGSGCNHEPWQPLPSARSVCLCLGPARLTPAPKKSTFPHWSQQHTWRLSSKTCRAGCTQAITEISDSLCVSPLLDIVELQLLLLGRTHAELPSLTSFQRSPPSSLKSLFHAVF